MNGSKRKFKIDLKTLLFSGLIMAVAVFVTFDGIGSIYFLQDEWMGFGRTIALGFDRIWTQGSANHITLLSSALFYLNRVHIIPNHSR